MVFFILSKYVTKWIGTPLFRSGLRLRNKLIPTGNKIGYGETNYLIDMACLIPYSQKIISLAIYDESKRRMNDFRKQRQEQQQQSKVEADDKNNNKTMMTTTTLAEDTMKMMTDPIVTRRLSNIRVAVLDEYLRPSLLPNNRWSDVENNWRYHLRVVAWARKEFLISKYGPHIQEALMAYPQLRNSPQLLGTTSGGSGGSLRRRRMFLDLVHRGEINLDNNKSNNSTMTSPFLQLPLSSVIINAFRMKRWNNEKNTEGIGQSMIPVAEKLGSTMLRQQSCEVENDDGKIDSQKESIMTRNHVDVPVDTDLSSTNIEDILDVVTRGYVKNCGPLNALCQEANFYQLWSREYVKHLGDYLLDRTASRRSEAHTNNTEEGMPMISQDTVILDIGAGDGVLMHCLRDYMERKVMGVPDNRKSNNRKSTPKTGGVIPTMVAIDDMSWRIFTKGPVEKLSAEQALDKYSTTQITQTTPDNATDSTSSLSSDQSSSDQQDRSPQVIVLCSWMPMGQDWTALFRKEGVDEYILIGEADDGSVGDNWLTWGNPAFYAKNDNDTNDDNVETDRKDNDNGVSPTPPYATEGYQRWDMDDLTKFQFSSFDLAVSKSSKTVSFRNSL